MFPFLIVPLALALGLATHHRAPAPTAAAGTSDGPVTIAFRNDAMDLATVYAVPDVGMAVRLGEVTPGQTAKLVIPRSVVPGLTSVNIVAVPFAHNFATGSGPVTVAPGDAFTARLDANEDGVWVLPAR